MAKMLLYNAGDRIKEPISYSLPQSYGDVHAVARWELDAPAQSFFSVPTDLQIGVEKIHVEFAYDIIRKFGERGVILVADEGEEIAPESPMAATREEAEAKGKEFWRTYLEKIVRVHLEQCAEIRARGGAPRTAQGFTKRALKLLNMPDPGDELFAKKDAPAPNELDALKQQMNAMQSMFESMKATNAQLMAILASQVQGKTDAAIDEKAAKKAGQTK